MFDRFSDGARRLVTRAGAEAQHLGHHPIGTEHLLLGMVADEQSSAARSLLAAGATLDGCRSKVREAVGPDAGGPGAGAPGSGHPPALSSQPDFTDRARRALERADRLSLRRRDPQVEPDHVLVSLLDVEGRAGQVLRGLGVDVVELRETALAALGQATPTTASTSTDAETRPVQSAVGPRCGACGAALDGALAHRTLRSRDEQGQERDTVVVYCSACGLAIGALPSPPAASRPRR